MIKAKFKEGADMIQRRGVIIHPHELSESWLKQAQVLQLNVLGLHPPGGPDAASNLAMMLEDLRTQRMQRLLDQAQTMGLTIEYEMHAVSYLLPRSLFASHPDLFRMNEKGERTPDFNLCASSRQALESLAESAARLAALLPSASHRYYFWLDDVTQSSCHCPHCRDLTPSDQQLLCVHAMLDGIRSVDPKASLAYIAYLDALRPPKSVQPAPGVFLEYAPIKRRLDASLNDPRCAENQHECAPLPALLQSFGRQGAQVLEYWLDNSLLSGWKLPPKPYKLQSDVLRSDVAYYRSLGFQSITSFACYLGAEYVALHGEPDLSDYGKVLSHA